MRECSSGSVSGTEAPQQMGESSEVPDKVAANAEEHQVDINPEEFEEEQPTTSTTEHAEKHTAKP